MPILPRKGILAIAAVVDIALHDGDAPVSAKTLAVRHGLPPRHLEPVLQALVRDGILKGIRGPGGGYQLARKADTVTFRDIIEAVEGPITLNVCTDGSSSCALQPTCRMYRVWEKGQRVLLEVFSDTSLAEIAASRPAPPVVCAPTDSVKGALSSAKSGAA